MTGKIDVRDLEAVDRLIRAEIEEGLAVFNAGDSEARLRARMARGAGPSIKKIRLAKAAVPAVLAAAAGAIVLFVLTRPPAGRRVDPAAFAAVLGRSPLMSGFASRPTPAPDRASDFPDAEDGLGKALAIVARDKDGEEREALLGAGRDLVPSYSTKERMRILCEERVIERALALLIEKAKE